MTPSILGAAQQVRSPTGSSSADWQASGPIRSACSVPDGSPGHCAGHRGHRHPRNRRRSRARGPAGYHQGGGSPTQDYADQPYRPRDVCKFPSRVRSAPAEELSYPSRSTTIKRGCDFCGRSLESKIPTHYLRFRREWRKRLPRCEIGLDTQFPTVKQSPPPLPPAPQHPPGKYGRLAR